MSASAGIAFASNRGPVSFVDRNGGFTTKRGAGGLAGALDPVARRLGDGAIWIAAATSESSLPHASENAALTRNRIAIGAL
jgi:hypothetical protein